MPRTRSAYTLLELMLVLALLVILGALAYPSIDGMYGNLRLRAGADAVRGAMAQARARAMEEATPYRFAVVPGRGNYRVAPENGAYWSGGDPPAPADSNNPPLVIEGSLPRGIPFILDDSGPVSAPNSDNGSSNDTPDSGSYTPVVTFLPDGTATADKQITLQLAGGGTSIVLELRSLTGVVTIHQPKENP